MPKNEEQLGLALPEQLTEEWRVARHADRTFEILCNLLDEANHQLMLAHNAIMAARPLTPAQEAALRAELREVKLAAADLRSMVEEVSHEQ